MIEFDEITLKIVEGRMLACASFDCHCYAWFDPSTGILTDIKKDIHLCYKHNGDHVIQQWAFDRTLDGATACHRCHTLPSEPDPIIFNIQGLEVKVRMCEPCRSNADGMRIFVEQVASAYRSTAAALAPRAKSQQKATGGKRRASWMDQLGI